MSFKLDPGAPLGREIVRVIREQLADAMALAVDRQEPPGERIRCGRAACKKARAALKLLRHDDREAYRRENRWLAGAARKLGRLRDADATAAALAVLLAQPAPAARRRLLAAAARFVGAALPQSRPRDAIGRKLARFAARLGQADVRLARWMPADDLDGAIADHRRTYRKARAGFHGAQELGTAKAFHEWRKALKAYAHQCRLFRAAWPRGLKAERNALKQLGAVLGEEHDLAVLRKHLRRLRRADRRGDGDEALSALLDTLDRRRDALQLEALQLGERLLVERPRLMADRMSGWWRAATI